MSTFIQGIEKWDNCKQKEEQEQKAKKDEGTCQGQEAKGEQATKETASEGLEKMGRGREY